MSNVLSLELSQGTRLGALRAQQPGAAGLAGDSITATRFFTDFCTFSKAHAPYLAHALARDAELVGTKAMMRAHGFSIDMLLELVRANANQTIPASERVRE
jgi:hypothetical protein